MSRMYNLNLLDVRNAVVHALIVFAASVGLVLLSGINTEVFGPYQAAAISAITFAITLLKRYVQDNTIT